MIKFILLLIPAILFAQDHGVIESGASKLFYRTYGAGEPLLIINGGPGMNSNGFTELAKSLSHQRMTVVYDQRGTGKSSLEEISNKTITMDLMIGDIENLRRSLGLKKWNVLGHSFGGMLAAYYVSKFPQSIEKVIFSSSGGIDLGLLEYVSGAINDKLSKAQRDSLRYWSSKIQAGDQSFKAQIGRGRALAPAYVYDKTNIESVACRLTEGNSEINALVWQDLRTIGFDCSKSAKKFNNKVLVIQGKNDILKIETAERIQRAFPQSSLVLLENCGHYGWLDQPEKYFFEIENFLKT